jgi:micrococcal nuclease
MYEYVAIVRKITDGDSIWADVDLGFHQWAHDQELRLIGIQAPDKHPAKEAATAWMRDALPLGSKVTITTIKDKREKYGRMLALVFLTSKIDGSQLCLNGAIVDAGHAVEWDGKGTKPDI